MNDSSDIPLFGPEHVDRYEATDGEEGHIWQKGSTVGILTTTGRKSGEERRTPLIYGQDNGNYLIVASLFGGVLTLAILRFRAVPLPRLLAGQAWAERLHRMDTGIPYGIALALAALMIYPDTPWMKSLGM